MQAKADSAIMRMGGAVPDASITPSFRYFPHRAEDTYDVFGENGLNMIYVAVVFNFVVQTSTMVEERQKRLPEMLQQMGMWHSAYMMSWIVNHLLTNVFCALILAAFGAICRFDFFVENDFGLLLYSLFVTMSGLTGLALYSHR